jgi:sulfatase maturation enzyme AslB (radical SAM superfamily)
LEQKYIDVTKDNFNINFIVNPNTIDLSQAIFQSMLDRGITNINILPIYATINWNKTTLIKFNIFIQKIKTYKNIYLH